MMTITYHVIAIALLIGLVWALAFWRGLKKGERRALRRMELEAEAELEGRAGADQSPTQQ